MATYKVIQDIEAEDHILGPLTLRQFIFALISVFFFYLSFIVITKGVAFVAIIFLPPALFFGFFAIPFGRDQSTEVWALAKLRFWLKPNRRVWDQSGIKELVTITVPKKIEQHLTNGLNQYEVASRLKVLANTLDSRGWAIKNYNMSQMVLPSATADPDRLIDISSIPQVSDEIFDESDILDDSSSPVAQHFTQIIDEASRSHRQQLIDAMNSDTSTTPSTNNASWFMPKVAGSDDSSTTSVIYSPDVEAQQETTEENMIVSRIRSQQRAQQLSASNLRTLKPDNVSPPVSTRNPVTNDSTQPISTQSQLTDQPDPGILSLASSDDLSVATIAHEAKRAKGDNPTEDEVVISLH